MLLIEKKVVFKLETIIEDIKQRNIQKSVDRLQRFTSDISHSKEVEVVDIDEVHNEWEQTDRKDSFGWWLFKSKYKIIRIKE